MNDTKLNENLPRVVAVGGILLMHTMRWRDEVTKTLAYLVIGGTLRMNAAKGGGGVRLNSVCIGSNDVIS